MNFQKYRSSICFLLTVAYVALSGDIAFANNSAIRIVGIETGETAKRTRGTAVFVEFDDKLFLLTAYHVIRELSELYLVVGEEDSNQINPFDASFVNPKIVIRPDLELCVFELTQDGANWLKSAPRSQRPVKIAPMIVPGARVIAIGNPMVKLFRGETSMRTLHPLNIAASATLARTVPARELLGDLVSDNAMDTKLHELSGVGITHGYSGGPLLIDTLVPQGIQQELVGILIGGDPKSGITTWGTTVEGIPDALTDDMVHQFPPTPWPKLAFADKVYSLPENIALQFPARFPAQGFFEQRRVAGSPWHMKTFVTISENGRVDGVTETVTDEFLQGFTGRAVLFFSDASGNVLTRTDSPEYGVPIGITKKRRENWTAQINDQDLARVRSVRIEHFHAPNTDKLEEAIAQLVQRVDVGGERRTILKTLSDSFNVQLRGNAK